MKKQVLIALLLLVVAVNASQAQIVNPVHWKSAVRMTDDTHGVVTLTASIEAGWHLYDTQLPDGGPVPTTVEWKKLEGVKLEGGLSKSPKPHEEHDATFDMTLRWWTGKATLSQRFTVTGEKYAIEGNVRYMACNDETCTAPTTEPFAFKGEARKPAEEPDDTAGNPADDSIQEADTAAVADTLRATAPVLAAGDTWAPVTTRADDSGTAGQPEVGGMTLWRIFALCFLGGLLALFTPCVWPIIPMTVSFFLKKSGGRARSIRDAVIYGLSIIVIYVALGLVVSAIFGASALNALATNAVCNIIFFLLLVLFAVSFFGAFEIKLPSSWSNKMDGAAGRTTGLLSIFFMAFTLVLVSFSCTGPIIGTLLVEAASQGTSMGPAIGMLGFAIALAIPFTLFALFPSWLKKLPRSGGWMNTVKVVLGFLELALSLKFLSVADLAYGWHILDREVFLALWIAIFGLLALYLLGIFRFESDGEPQHNGVGVTRFLLGLVSLAFTAYLVPGLWGAPLRVTSAFVPPLSTQDFNLYGGELTQFTDFDQGMAAAAQQGKPVFVDFSGFGCVNCRKMEGAVLDRDEVKQLITDRFVTIQLMVDDKTPLPQPRYVEENGRQVELSTTGDLWSYLQRHKFGANSQPYYVILDPQGNLLSGPFAYKEDVSGFLDFLRKGLTPRQ
ncbi:MAG: thioredoxin family protein [Muribaculaceae bacterium]|nr:thioredoxin family protein [Muribaculaceae bacterium]